METKNKKSIIHNAKKKLAKVAIATNTVLTSVSVAMMSASAANAAPAGVDAASYNTVVNIVYWIVVAAIGAASLPGIQGIVKGQTDDDMRQRNSGIVSVVVAGCCVGAATAIKNICF